MERCMDFGLVDDCNLVGPDKNGKERKEQLGTLSWHQFVKYILPLTSCFKPVACRASFQIYGHDVSTAEKWSYAHNLNFILPRSAPPPSLHHKLRLLSRGCAVPL